MTFQSLKQIIQDMKIEDWEYKSMQIITEKLQDEFGDKKILPTHNED